MRLRNCPWLPVLAMGLVVLTPAWVLSQVRAGSEFRANTYTTDGQRAPTVAREPDGDFVVVWHSYTQDGDATGVFGQRYDASGATRGAEFRANTYTPGYQYLPWVAADGKGRFVVAWYSYGIPPNTFPSDIFAKRYDANGAPIGGEFLVNTYTTAEQFWGRVAAAPNGDFAIVWESEQGQNLTEIMAQRFDRTGRRLGGEFQVNTVTTGYQLYPAIDVQPNNRFVVAWSGPDGGTYGIFARRFDAGGNPLGAEFRVNTYTTNYQMYPSVTATRAGNFVVVWQSLTQDGSGYGVFGQRYDANGAAQGGEFQVNTYTTNFQSGRPSVAMDDGGNFVVSWRSLAPQDGSGYAPMARRFFSSGLPRSPEFTVNTYTTGFQDMPHVGGDRAGNFTVVWRSFGQDGSYSGVFGQRFGGLHPRALDVDTAAGPTQDGNRVLEPGEAADVGPFWQNLTGASQTFAATLGNISGPTGCVEAIVDGVASYGTVGNGVQASCVPNCYAVSTTASIPRCAQHWDIRTIETLTPDAQGQAKEWLLHVGSSFTDVPTTNPFYRFIEILFHHNVTGGCGGTNYCPSASTTREQMAVFVLVGKEGSGYVPPACTTPVFGDVPAASPFCRFIEELARRNVVTGCGGGNYCPSDPVTREQMAVFVLATLDPTLNPPACAPPNIFDDVPETSPFCRWIEELARRGVVTGCSTNPPRYCPSDPVTREQMAVFISRTFGLILYGP